MIRALNTGLLRQYIYIEEPTAQRTAGGQNKPTWDTFAPAWARIDTLSGRQLAISLANTITATSTHQVVIRYIDGVLTTMRIRYGEFGLDSITLAQLSTLSLSEFSTMGLGTCTPRVFNIDAIDNTEERNIQIVITATEVKA